MISKNRFRWQKKVLKTLHAVGYRVIDVTRSLSGNSEPPRFIFSKILSITFLSLAFQLPHHANAESSDVDYAVPPSIDLPTERIAFKEPQDILSLSEALSPCTVTQSETCSFRMGSQGKRSPYTASWIVA